LKLTPRGGKPNLDRPVAEPEPDRKVVKVVDALDKDAARRKAQNMLDELSRGNTNIEEVVKECVGELGEANSIIMLKGLFHALTEVSKEAKGHFTPLVMALCTANFFNAATLAENMPSIIAISADNECDSPGYCDILANIVGTGSLQNCCRSNFYALVSWTKTSSNMARGGLSKWS